LFNRIFLTTGFLSGYFDATYAKNMEKKLKDKIRPDATSGGIQEQEEKRIYAYEVQNPNRMLLATAPLNRAWMDDSDQRFAYRCLPMLMANTAGWLIKNPVKFSVWWKGGNKKENLIVEFADGHKDDRIASHFGSGVLTFKLPYLFKTPQNINLWVKGPSNWPKDGIQALEGIVESDWSASTFTMNWILTRPNHLVSFDEGDPICMIIPVMRGLAESLMPVQNPISTNQPFQAEYNLWQQKREKFLEALARQAPEAVRQGWEKDYFKGANPGGKAALEHQTQINLKDFKTD
jgi:hypothetical protein